MDKAELKVIADSVFERYPNVKIVYATSDGQTFFEEVHAKNHATKKELEIETIKRDGADESTEADEPVGDKSQGEGEGLENSELYDQGYKANEALQVTVGELQGKLKQAETDKATADGEVEMLKGELTAANDAKETMQGKVEKLEKSFTELSDELTKLTTANQSLTTQLAELQAKQDEAPADAKPADEKPADEAPKAAKVKPTKEVEK